MTENLEQIESVEVQELKTIAVDADQFIQIRLLLAQAYNYEGAATVSNSQNAIDALTKASAETDPQRAMLMQSVGSLSAVIAQQETINSNLLSQVQFCKETIAILLLMLEEISPLNTENAEAELEPIEEPKQETELATAE
jgi:hypothetical protein